MADPWHYTDPERSAWWDDAWRPTPRWLSALGADHAQSLDWPTAAQQSSYKSPAETVIHTAPSNAIAPSQDTRCSGQDAFTQTHSLTQAVSAQSAQPSLHFFQHASTRSVHPSTFTHDASTQLSWSILPRRRICSKKRSRALDSRPHADGSPAAIHTGSPPVQLERGLLCCVPLVLRVLLNIYHLLVWMYNMTGYLLTSSPRSQAPALASDAQGQYRSGENTESPPPLPLHLPPFLLKSLMPAPPQWDNSLPLPSAACTRGLSVPPRREHNPS